MAGKSKNRNDVYLWLHKVIESCESIGHIKSVKNLIINFNKKGDSDYLYSILKMEIRTKEKIVTEITK